jgi:hypothetical protein
MNTYFVSDKGRFGKSLAGETARVPGKGVGGRETKHSVLNTIDYLTDIGNADDLRHISSQFFSLSNRQAAKAST